MKKLIFAALLLATVPAVGEKKPAPSVSVYVSSFAYNRGSLYLGKSVRAPDNSKRMEVTTSDRPGRTFIIESIKGWGGPRYLQPGTLYEGVGEKGSGVTSDRMDRWQALIDPLPRCWLPAFNMTTDYYDHPLEVTERSPKGFQALADYDGIYEMTSHYVHVTAISAMANYDASPFKTAQRDKEEDRAVLALHFSLVYIFEICIIIGRQWDSALLPEVNQTIQRLLEDLRKIALVTERGVWTVGH